MTTASKERKTETFSVRPDERETLRELAEYFGDGSPTAYVRATYDVMKAIMVAEQLRDLQARGQQRLDEQGLTLDDVDAITRRIVKGK